MTEQAGLERAAQWHEAEAERIGREMDVSRLDPDGNYLGGSPETAALIRMKEHKKSADELRAIMASNTD